MESELLPISERLEIIVLSRYDHIWIGRKLSVNLNDPVAKSEHFPIEL